MEFTRSFKVNQLSIPFDSNWGSIAVSLSGGADSALLAYLLCSHISQDNSKIKVHLISHVRNWKTKPWQETDSENVWNWLVDKFPSLPITRHVNFIAPDLEWGDKGPCLIDEYGKTVSGDNIQIRSFAEYVCHQHNIDAYYNAVTKNPPGVEFKGMPTRDVEPNASNQHLLIMQHMGKWAIHPFRFIDKSWIYRQYLQLDILDLWNLTRSCEGTVQGLDYKNYNKNTKSIPVCGECFWCKEREWAIEQSK